MHEAEIKLDWLKQAMDLTGLKATPLAKKAGLSAGTLLNFLNDPVNTSPPRDTTLNAIAFAHGLTPYNGSDNPTPGNQGFAEDIAEQIKPIDVGGEEKYRLLVNTYKNKDNNDFWVMKGRALENLGIMNGDVLLVEYDRAAQVGDIVCISLRDEQNMKGRTVFREMASTTPVPVCFTATNDESINLDTKVIFIDGINAQIFGVVSMSLREYPKRKKV